MTEFKEVDANGSGAIEKSEWDALNRTIDLEDRRRLLDDEDAQRDAQRKMTWFALSGMLLFPFAIILCDVMGLDQAMNSLSSISGVYFISASALVGSFFGFSKMGGKK